MKNQFSYKRKQQEMLNEEDMDSSSSKYMKLSEVWQQRSQKLILLLIVLII